ncbi:MAG: uracil-DNA glycosylase [SAR324 cluster bacterium]|nr:uracil-DNA glycosylase [SAR324 cluster bacterium]
MEALRAQYSSCQRCSLGATRNNFVFGAGNSQTSLVFIGEGPGADEDRLGEPFVGKAGKLLNKMIHSIGIDRRDVYISNVVKCRPPENRNPEPIEIAKCFSILQRQLELIKPRLIVTLGNVPTRALIPNAPGITRARGQTYHYQHWPVLPTFHPAYLLRNPSAMNQSWDDFKKIMSLCFESKER